MYSVAGSGERTLGLDDFADRIEPVGPRLLCQDLYRRFSADPDLLSVPVVEDGAPLGLVHRGDFMMRLAHHFGRALYAKKPVTVLMDPDPLTLDRALALESVKATITGTRPCALVKGFIITDGGRYAALGTALSLIRHSLVQAEERTAELAAALDAARRAGAAKSAFLATMSHELRTPLNAVIGFSDLIVEQALGTVDEGYVGYARAIREGGEHLLSIVTDVLDFAKTESGQVELHEEVFDLREEIERTARILATQASRRQVTLDVLPGGPAMLTADPRLTRQMMLNLAGNAVKFTPAGGHVRLSCGLEADGGAFFAVADEGCGMDEAEIEIAIQPFRQIDNGLTRRHEGTGLGLPLVKAYAEAHGGALTLTSRKGAGTRAEVRYPARRTIAAERAA